MFEVDSQQIEFDSFKELFDFSRDVLWAIGPDGKIIYVSSAIFTLRGIDSETAKSQTIDQIHPPESAKKSTEYFLYMMDEIKAGRKPAPFKGELDYFHADGSVLTTEVYAVPMFDHTGTFTCLTGLSRDVSRRLLQEATKTATRKARKAELRSMLNLVLEHEARNTLTLMMHALNTVTPSSSVTLALNAAEKFIEVLKQINLFSQSTTNKIHFVPKTVKVGCAIREVEKVINPVFPFELLDDGQLSVWGEYSLIHMCLLQLLGNANKYASPQTTVRVEVFMEDRNDKAGVAIKIINEHWSSVPLDITRLFMPFYRAPHVTSLSGSGLGLPIAARLAKMLDGDVTVQQYGDQVIVCLWLLAGKPN